MSKTSELLDLLSPNNFTREVILQDITPQKEGEAKKEIIITYVESGEPAEHGIKVDFHGNRDFLFESIEALLRLADKFTGGKNG